MFFIFLAIYIIGVSNILTTAFAGTMPFKELISLVLTTYILKAVVSILDTPVIYIAKKMKNKETIIKSEEAF